MDEIKLQPLRITAGWHVEWNLFYAVDPKEGYMHYLDSSSLLHLVNHQLMRCIHLDFKPENDCKGDFHLRVLNLTKTVNKKGIINYEGDWENPYFEIKSKSRKEVVQEIERLVVETPIFKNNKNK